MSDSVSEVGHQTGKKNLRAGRDGEQGERVFNANTKLF